jgi:hypothetical protein
VLSKSPLGREDVKPFGRLWTVNDAAILTMYHPQSIRAAIRAGELEAVERVYYRSTAGGKILRRRYYAIPDWCLNNWVERKILRVRADGRGWQAKRGPKT